MAPPVTPLQFKKTYVTFGERNAQVETAHLFFLGESKIQDVE